LSNIKNVHDQYQSIRENRNSKQTALGILGTAQSSLNPAVQLLAPLFNSQSINTAVSTINNTQNNSETTTKPQLPSLVPFVNSDWESLSTTEKTKLIIWAKQLQEIQTDIPITITGWNSLSATKKTSAVNWAINRFGKKPDNTTDREFVLSAIRSLMGITPDLATKLDKNTPTVSEETINRDFVIRTTWDLWTYPENYIDSWDASSELAKQFLELKNKARSVYASVQNNLAIAYSVSEAQKSLDQITFAINDAKNLLHDCNLIKTIAKNNSLLKTDPDGHSKLKTIIISQLGQFKSDDMRTSIQNGGSILSKPIFQNYINYGSAYQLSCSRTFEDNTISAQSLNTTSGTDNQQINGFCHIDTDLIPGNYGIDDNASQLSERERNIYNKFQVQPALNIWDLISQGEDFKAFCGFTYFMKEYGSIDSYTPNRLLDGGQSILCGSDVVIQQNGIPMADGWYTVDPTTIRNIIYKTDE
jgi:hypothetical protein